MELIKKYKLELIFAALGALGGYLYWYYVGCATGTCAITSSWHTSSLYGVVMGFLVGQMVTEQIDKKKKKSVSSTAEKEE